MLEKKGRFCRAVASFRAVFCELLCLSGSSCSLASERSQPGHTLHRRGGGPQHWPPLAAKKAEDKPPQDQRQHKQVQGCEDGAKVEMDVQLRVAVAFSIKVTPAHPCWLLHWLFISSCFEAAESVAGWEREPHLL